MNVLELFKTVKTFALDVDGVLTDSTVLLFENGLQARSMNIRDGLALQMALKNGFNIIVISGARSEPVIDRLKKLGIVNVYTGVHNKKEFLHDHLVKNNLNWQEVVFMGDDLPDIAAMKTAGVAACPANAVNEIKEIAQYISPVDGGAGCVRDLIEKVLKVQHKWLFDLSVTSR